MTIKFRFHPEKAVEAAAILLKLHGKPMKYGSSVCVMQWTGVIRDGTLI